MASSASASISVTAEPATETAPVAASSTSLSVPERVAFTSKAAFAGAELVSSAPSKVTVSVAPFTAAEENAGGVLLVANTWGAIPKFSTSLPDRSRSGLPGGSGWS